MGTFTSPSAQGTYTNPTASPVLILLIGKNKRTRRDPTPLVEAGEPKHSHQSLEVDIASIAKEAAFLFSYSPQMGLLSVDHMPTSSHLWNHINNFRSHQYSVTEIRSEEEPGILALWSDLNAMGIKLTTGVRNSKNTSTPGSTGRSTS
jgi:hypothetical protein